MALLRSALFALIFYLGSVVAVLSAFVAAIFGPRPLWGVVRAWALFHRYCATWILGIRSRLEGVRPRGPVFYAAKHQSMYETIELVLLLDMPVPVLKQELADIPFWGWVARRYGAIPVDREGGAKTLRAMVREARQVVAAGRPLLIFPEGTRVAPGEQPPLQPGFAGLYRALGLPVVPVALNSGRLWPRGSFVKRPGIVTVRLAEPIPPGLARDAIEPLVHAQINALEPPP